MPNNPEEKKIECNVAHVFEEGQKFCNCKKMEIPEPTVEVEEYDLFYKPREVQRGHPPKSTVEEWEKTFEKLIWEEYGDDGTNERFKDFIRQTLLSQREQIQKQAEKIIVAEIGADSMGITKDKTKREILIEVLDGIRAAVRICEEIK